MLARGLTDGLVWTPRTSNLHEQDMQEAGISTSAPHALYLKTEAIDSTCRSPHMAAIRTYRHERNCVAAWFVEEGGGVCVLLDVSAVS